ALRRRQKDLRSVYDTEVEALLDKAVKGKEKSLLNTTDAGIMVADPGKLDKAVDEIMRGYAIDRPELRMDLRNRMKERLEMAPRIEKVQEKVKAKGIMVETG